MVAAVTLAVAALAVCTAVCTAVATGPPAVIKTTLQIFPPDDDRQPSSAARHWQRDALDIDGPSSAYGGFDDTDSAPPHKLSAVQQTHILDDIRRHNLHQQPWTASSSAPSSSTANAVARAADGDGRERPRDDPTAADQLQQLLQINGVAAADDVQDRPDDERRGRQKPVGWHARPPQLYNRQHQQQQQLFVTSPAGDGIDADVERQIRQQLTAVANNSYAMTSATGGDNSRSRQSAASSVQYVQIGNGDGAQLGKAAGNTIVKTVIVRQKPAVAPPPPPSPAPAPAPAPQQPSWTAAEQQQLEQLARQVLPPGVAQYEIIRAGGVDGKTVAGDDATAAATSVDQPPRQPASAAGKKKPVTFVILEERPDGTVRVRGVEKKQHGGGGDAVPDSAPAAADDEQLQQLVDKLNRGELRLPSSSNARGTDGAAAASTTTTTASSPSTAQPRPSDDRDKSDNEYRPPSTYAPAASLPHRHDFFVPTAVPSATATAATVVPTADGDVGQQQHRHHHNQHRHHQQYRTTPAVTAAAASTTQTPFNSTSSSYHDDSNKAAKDGSFSSVLRRRGYYAMAKYMRQAGVDAVLEDTGPFTVFVPTDKAFRALLVQLGGPDRAEEKFRENPRLLIGLLLHHVVPGAFKAADLRAGDEMTGVSLAGTQLRANLYARQIYDNRWNDIEVLTINGARVLDDVSAEASTAIDDGPAFDDDGGPVQRRRDMVLSSSSGNGGGDGGGDGGSQQITAIAHAVDRVLFPLPVGDVLATMRADRQRRYSVFLRVVDEHCSPGVRALLSGTRTVTVFAPTDEAFRGRANYSGGSGSIVDRLFRGDRPEKQQLNSRRTADRFALSHVVLAGVGDPPMYTAGLRFYQVRDTAYRLRGVGGRDPAAVPSDDADDEDGEDRPAADGDKPRHYQLTVYKDSGRIRLNGGAAQVIVRNVPATNGVLHGLDAPLV